jgi:hypothetical protein
MKLVFVVLALETVPLGILVSVAWGNSPRRRSRFWWRLAGLAMCVTVPVLILTTGFSVGLVGEQAFGVLLWGGFIWGFGLAALAPLLLFYRPGSSPGPSDDGPDGPDPGDDGPRPRRPLGGVPLPDAQPSAMRTRGPHSRRHPVDPRRPAREPKRAPSRLWPVLPWSRLPAIGE